MLLCLVSKELECMVLMDGFTVSIKQGIRINGDIEIV